MTWIGGVFTGLILLGITALAIFSTFLGTRAVDRWIRRRTRSEMIRSWVTVLSGLLLFVFFWLPALVLFGGRAAGRRSRRSDAPVPVAEG